MTRLNHRPNPIGALFCLPLTCGFGARRALPGQPPATACQTANPGEWYAVHAIGTSLPVRSSSVTLSLRRRAVPGSWLLLLAGVGQLLLPLAVACAQERTSRYEFHREHDPDGIGKFYCGREIAQVMGHQAADWLERPERAEEERPALLLDQLKIKPGEAVADIGAGTGYFTRPLAKAVGPAGRVFAEDIQPEMLRLLTNRMAQLGLTNVVPVLGTVTNPQLPAASVDLVLLVDVYHEFDFPYEMMAAICGALRPGGRVVFVEYRGEDPAVPIKPLHKMTEAQVRKEMSAQPLEWVETSRVLPRQHIIIFRKRTSNEK